MNKIIKNIHVYSLNKILLHLSSYIYKNKEEEKDSSILKSKNLILNCIKSEIRKPYKNSKTIIDDNNLKPDQKLLFLIIIELYKRLSLKKITTTQDIIKNISPKFRKTKREILYFLLLNKGKYIIKKIGLSQNEALKVSVSISNILKIFIKYKPAYLVIVHNHILHGKIKPSIADKITTQKILFLCNLFGIQLIDHIILAEKDYFSFASKNLIEQYQKNISNIFHSSDFNKIFPFLKKK